MTASPLEISASQLAAVSGEAGALTGPAVTSSAALQKSAAATVALPAAPSFKATVVSSTQINLSWNAVSGASGYLIDLWISNAWKQIGSTSGTIAAVTGLSPGTTYDFDVGAYNAAGDSWANYQSATTLKSSTFAPPAAPALTATAVSNTQVNLSWNNVSGASGYLVQKLINGAWSQIASLGSGVTSYSVAGLSPGTTYTFRVGAYNSAGTSWANSQSATTSKSSPPAAPSLTAAQVSSTQINLSWNNVSGATGYVVQKLVNGAWSQIGNLGAASNAAAGGPTTNAELGGNTTTDPVSGLSPGTTYTFRVGAYNSAGTSWANSQSATTPSTSTSWSGYYMKPPGGQQVTAVGGTWVQPTVTSTGTNSTTSFWVGIDGADSSSQTVEQLGTTWGVLPGSPAGTAPTYYAWIEFFGDQRGSDPGPYYLPKPINSIIGNNYFNIQPGDTISAQVTYVSSTSTTSTFAFVLTDTPRGGQAKSWHDSLQTSYVVPARTSGEWIVESPGSAANPLAKFTPVDFSGAWATTYGGTPGGLSSGATGPISAFTNYALDMVTSGTTGGGTDSTSSLTNSSSPYGSSFVVTFGSANGGTNSTAMAQPGLNATAAKAASTPLPSTHNVGFSAVDRIMAALDEFGMDADALALGRLKKGNGLGMNPAQSALLDLYAR